MFGIIWGWGACWGVGWRVDGGVVGDGNWNVQVVVCVDLGDWGIGVWKSGAGARERIAGWRR